MAVHPDRMLVDRAGQRGECLEVGKCGLPVALVVLAQPQQLPRRRGGGDGVDDGLEDPRCVPVPLALEGADAGRHPLGDPVPELAPVRAGRRGQLVGDVRWELGRRLDGAVGRRSQLLAAGSLRRWASVRTHRSATNSSARVREPRRRSGLSSSDALVVRHRAHRARPPAGHAPPPLANHRWPRGPCLRTAVRPPPVAGRAPSRTCGSPADRFPQVDPGLSGRRSAPRPRSPVSPRPRSPVSPRLRSPSPVRPRPRSPAWPPRVPRSVAGRRCPAGRHPGRPTYPNVPAGPAVATGPVGPAVPGHLTARQPAPAGCAGAPRARRTRRFGRCHADECTGRHHRHPRSSGSAAPCPAGQERR